MKTAKTPKYKAEAREKFPKSLPTGNPVTVQRRFMPTAAQPVNGHKRMAGC